MFCYRPVVTGCWHEAEEEEDPISLAHWMDLNLCILEMWLSWFAVAVAALRSRSAAAGLATAATIVCHRRCLRSACMYTSMRMQFHYRTIRNPHSTCNYCVHLCLCCWFDLI